MPAARSSSKLGGSGRPAYVRGAASQSSSCVVEVHAVLGCDAGLESGRLPSRARSDFAGMAFDRARPERFPGFPPLSRATCVATGSPSSTAACQALAAPWTGCARREPTRTRFRERAAIRSVRGERVSFCPPLAEDLEVILSREAEVRHRPAAALPSISGADRVNASKAGQSRAPIRANRLHLFEVEPALALDGGGATAREGRRPSPSPQ